MWTQDGTYAVTYAYPNGGTFEVDIKFLGTFQGKAGRVRGSPFRVIVLEEAQGVPSTNDLDGPLMIENIRKQVKDTKEYSSAAIKSIKKNVPKDDVEALIKIKEVLKDVEAKRAVIELGTDSNRAALLYFKSKGGQMDKMIETLDHTATLWTDVVRLMPVVITNLAPLVKTWSSIIEEQMDAYSREMSMKLKQFKTRSLWGGDLTPAQARVAIRDADAFLQIEHEELLKKTGMCQTFDFPLLVRAAKESADEMTQDLQEMTKLWVVMDNLQQFMNESKGVLWREMRTDEMEAAAKTQVKAVKGLHKCTRWSKAYMSADKLSRDFLNTVPLVALLAAKSMRERHWEALKVVTKTDFTPPYKDPELFLGSILSLNLHDHVGDVEDICDQAEKGLKIENALAGLTERWSGIKWTMEPYKDTAVPLLRLTDDDYESLEADQLSVQSMLASRFVKEFEVQAQIWQRQLANVAEVFVYLGDIQRSWSYLEPLFIGSEEVKRELPEDAKRFEGLDSHVKKELTACWGIMSVEKSCNQEGLVKRLEAILQQLDMCKKSLADFLDGRRRQFPRYYFTSEADLLDILSNGSQPEKVLKHTSKVYLACRTLLLDTERTPGGRPYALSWVSEVGVETVEFEPRVPLIGKVEIYQQSILDAMKITLFNNLKRSIVRYDDMTRSEWLMHKKDSPNPQEYASDPAQIILLTLAIHYVQEVETVFKDYADDRMPNENYMRQYSERQVDQLKELIRLTQTKLNKSDRTRVMVCITMDAHARDIVLGMIRDNVQECSAFQWQSQLKHKYRVPPPTASFINRDMHLRGKGGERAEIAIADAVMPYDYEYLGNGPRLVITPLTDRIYVTATQALNLKMGCAPAGPAGTGD